MTVDLPEGSEMGRKIGEALGHIGNLDVDIMRRADGAYCVLELNPRFGGGYPFSYEAGVNMFSREVGVNIFNRKAGENMPLAIIKWLRGEYVDPSILQPEYGRMFVKNDWLVEVGGDACS